MVAIGYASPRLRAWFALVVSALTFAIALYGGLTFTTAQTESFNAWLPFLNLLLQVRVDGLSVLVSIFVSFLSMLVVVYSLGYMAREEGLTRYYSLLLLFVGGMLGLVMAGNLIQFYFFWEVVGICSALLIAFWSDREASRKAGLKAFVVTRFGDASLLLAVILLFTLLGSTSFDSVLGAVGSPALSGWTGVVVGLLILIGAMGKSAQVPLHVWLPDAMEGPTTVSALIHAATMVNAGVYLVIRMSPLFQSSTFLLDALLVVGLLSAAVGGVNAIAAEDLKRVLAYSTISQLGLMFVALGLASPLAATYQMMSQGFSKALAFLAAGSVITAVGTRDIERMGGLMRKMKYTYVGFAASVLAMSGVPPLIGFWSKEAVLSIASVVNPPVEVAILLLSITTAVYSFRALIKVFHGPSKVSQPVSESPVSMILPIAILSVTVVVVWVVLQQQPLVPFVQLGLPRVLSFATSMGALAIGVTSAYLAFSRFSAQTVAVMARSKPLARLRELLLQDLGFDAAYNALWSRLLLPLSGRVRSLQTGLLGRNITLILVAVSLVLILTALRVL